MVTFAAPAMLPALKQLWRECFGDTQEYIDFYFRERFCCENTLVWQEDGQPAAMLALLPAALTINGASRPVRYVYAVATLPARRGVGLSTRLLEHANCWVLQRGEELSLLAPATPALFEFYAKRGYFDAFLLKIVEFSPQKPAKAEFCEITAREYKALRDARFAGEGYLSWDEAAIDYALRENRFSGGFSCKILSETGQAAALCVKMEETLLVRETTLPDAAVVPVLSALALGRGCTRIKAKLSAKSALAGIACPLGMTSAPLGAGGYLNLILD